MSERLKIVFSAVLLAAMWAVISPSMAQTAACPVERAVYRPVSKDVHGDDGDYQVTLRRQRHHGGNEAPFIMTMTDSKTRLSFEFSFFQPNGYAQTLVIQRLEEKDDTQERKKSQAGDLPQSTALFFNSALATISPLFDRQPTAPAYMLFPDLGKACWYDHIADRTFVPPAGMWKLSGCVR